MTAIATPITGTHPYADKFPMLPDPELEELAESIRANGLRNPVVITPDGLILDGRNRAAACDLAGVEPHYVIYDGEDLAEYVIDANITRRNMSTGARAMATALVLLADGRREGGRWKRGSLDIRESTNIAMRDALTDAGIVLDFKPDLAPAVVNGDLPLDAAYQEAKTIKDSAERDKILEREQRRREKDEAKAEAERNAAIVADLTMAGSGYVELIQDGTMTPAAAWAAHLEDTRKEREEAAAKRRNDEQHARTMIHAIASLAMLEYPKNRAWAIRAVRDYPDAVPRLHRESHTPAAIRNIAGWLNLYADELEEAHAA
jgi:ParB-like chromosome segregation protein Spo0J